MFSIIYENVEKVNVDFGIKFEDLKNNKNLHKKLFFDKWGTPFRYKNNKLHYSEHCYKPNQKLYKCTEECYMEAIDLPFKVFFTKEEFERTQYYQNIIILLSMEKGDAK